MSAFICPMTHEGINHVIHVFVDIAAYELTVCAPAASLKIVQRPTAVFILVLLYASSLTISAVILDAGCCHIDWDI